MIRLAILLALLSTPSLAAAQSLDARASGVDTCRSALTDGDAACEEAAPAVPVARLGPGDRAHAYKVEFNTGAPRSLIEFTLNDAGTFTDGPNFNSPDGSAVQGCDFTDTNFQTLVCMTNDRLLFTVDVASGAREILGTRQFLGEDATDITYSVADDTWYALTTTCNETSGTSSLFTFSLTDDTTTRVVQGNELTCAIAMAAAPDGSMYGYGIFTDLAVRFDLTSGAFQVLGPIGFDARFAQAMDCDAMDGTCYAFGYSGGGANGIYTLDKTTGAMTRLGPLAPSAQYTAGAIAVSSVGVSSESGPSGAVSLDLVGTNPARDAVRVGLTVEATQAVSVRVYDALGREVETLHTGLVAAGSRLDLAVDVSAWASGVYVVRASGDGVSLTQSVTVVR